MLDQVDCLHSVMGFDLKITRTNGFSWVVIGQEACEANTYVTLISKTIEYSLQFGKLRLKLLGYRKKS